MVTELPPTYIHIGLPKAGSTWLQTSIFPNIQGIYYADTKQKVNQPVKNLIKAFIKASGGMNIKGGLEVGGFNQNILLDIKKELNIFRRNLNIPLLISCEGFTTPQYYSDLHGQKYGLEMLAEVVPNAKVIYLIRRQDAWVESLYRNWLHKGNSIEYQDFLENIKFSLDYFQIYKQLSDIFGVNNVFIQPIELVWNYPIYGRNFFASCFDISPAAIPSFQKETSKNIENIGSSMAQIAIKTSLQKVKRNLKKIGLYKFPENIEKKVRLSIKKMDMEFVRYGIFKKANLISDHHKKLLLDEYNQQNLKLSSTVNLSLKEFGYFDEFSTEKF